MSDGYRLGNFKFKGQRTYVHGTDFFEAISQRLNVFREGFLKELSFRLFTAHQCLVHIDTLEIPEAKVICQGRWRNTEGGGDSRFWVTETDEAVVDRYEFGESLLCRDTCIKEEKIFHRFNSEFSMIENIVALTKQYHNTELALSSGKWVFGQIVLNTELPSECGSIEINNYQNIKDRFSRNHIVLDDRRVGEIRFIVS